MGERKIIVAGLVILALGVGKAALQSKPLDIPIVGGLSFILLLSLLSAVSKEASNLAGNFAVFGMVIVLLADAGPLLDALQKQQLLGANPSGKPTPGIQPAPPKH